MKNALFKLLFMGFSLFLLSCGNSSSSDDETSETSTFTVRGDVLTGGLDDSQMVSDIYMDCNDNGQKDSTESGVSITSTNAYSIEIDESELGCYIVANVSVVSNQTTRSSYLYREGVSTAGSNIISPMTTLIDAEDEPLREDLEGQLKMHLSMDDIEDLREDFVSASTAQLRILENVNEVLGLVRDALEVCGSSCTDRIAKVEYSRIASDIVLSEEISNAIEEADTVDYLESVNEKIEGSIDSHLEEEEERDELSLQWFHSRYYGISQKKYIVQDAASEHNQKVRIEVAYPSPIRHTQCAANTDFSVDYELYIADNEAAVSDLDSLVALQPVDTMTLSFSGDFDLLTCSYTRVTLNAYYDYQTSALTEGDLFFNVISRISVADQEVIDQADDAQRLLQITTTSVSVTIGPDVGSITLKDSEAGAENEVIRVDTSDTVTTGQITIPQLYYRATVEFEAVGDSFSYFDPLSGCFTNSEYSEVCQIQFNHLSGINAVFSSDVDQVNSELCLGYGTIRHAEYRLYERQLGALDVVLGDSNRLVEGSDAWFAFVDSSGSLSYKIAEVAVGSEETNRGGTTYPIVTRPGAHLFDSSQDSTFSIQVEVVISDGATSSEENPGANPVFTNSSYLINVQTCQVLQSSGDSLDFYLYQLKRPLFDAMAYSVDRVAE